MDDGCAHWMSIAQSVVEEKQTRIVEILLASISSKGFADREDPRELRSGPDADRGHRWNRIPGSRHQRRVDTAGAANVTHLVVHSCCSCSAS